MGLLDEAIGVSSLENTSKGTHADSPRLTCMLEASASVPVCKSPSPLVCLVDLDGPLVVLIPDTADGGPPGVTLNLRPPGCSHGLPGGSVCDQTAGVGNGLGIVAWLVQEPCRPAGSFDGCAAGAVGRLQ